MSQPEKMPPEREVDYIVHDCLFAVGQSVGRDKQLDYDAIVWLRDRYRRKFLDAIVVNGNSWAEDRARLQAVGRFLGQRAAYYACHRPTIDRESAALAADEIEAHCNMRRQAALTMRQ